MDDAQLLHALAADYFDAEMAAEPFEATVFGVPGYDAEVPDPSRSADRAHSTKLAGLQERLDALHPAELGRTDRVTYAMLRRQLRDERATLDTGLSEVAVTGSIAGTLAGVVSTVPAVTLTDADAAQAYLERLGRLGGYVEQTLARHHEAAGDGRFATALGVRQAIEQAEKYLASEPDSDPLLRPTPPDGFDATAWRAAAREAVVERFRPALARYADGLAELLPNARGDGEVGLCHVPGGEDGYLAYARAHTTTESTPAEIHQLGLDLVAALREEFAELGGRRLGTSEVPVVLRRLREDPELRFETAEQIVTTVTDALRRAEAALPDFFRSYDIAPCQVTEMDEAEAKDSVLGYYMPPAADGSRPGTHCVNTYAPTIRARFEYETLAFHESVPGHHLQIGVGQSLTGLPDFRRFGYVTAHSEGWALYTERLCEEMGLYSEDLSRFGMVSFDAWRACRLVVDTGMHHFGWSRTRAVEYMRDNTALSYANIDNEVDRYIAYPGQALAYMVGRIRIDQLRKRATDALGSAFSMAEFHHRVLANGAVPLDTLEEIVDGWITEPQNHP